MYLYRYYYNGQEWTGNWRDAKSCKEWTKKHLKWWKDRGFNLKLVITKTKSEENVKSIK